MIPNATTPVLDIQGEIYGLLSSDSELITAGARIFDYVEEDSGYPRIKLGEAMESPDNHHGGFGRQTVVTLHVWTKSRGFKETIDIVDRINQLLDHKYDVFTLPRHTLISIKFEFLQTLEDEDPEIRHVVVRYRVTTEQE